MLLTMQTASQVLEGCPEEQLLCPPGNIWAKEWLVDEVPTTRLRQDMAGARRIAAE